MKITSIQLNNYRNYKFARLEGFGELNIVVGPNAQGKTNLLESIYLCGIGKPNRNVKDKELILWGENNATVLINVDKKYRKHSVRIDIDSFGKKRISIDSTGILKLASLLGTLNVIYFCPDEMRLIKDSPQDRRRFIDISLCQHNKRYITALSRYNNILEQRNKLLKSGMALNDIISTLPIWDIQLAEQASYVIFERKKYLEILNNYANYYSKYISDDKEELSLQYESDVNGTTVEEIKNDILSLIEKNRDKELDLHYTLEGPHRDDIKISVNKIDLRKYGSQGQQRTATLSIKLAEAKLFTEKTGDTPVVLLDDVLSELDENRTQKLLDALTTCQVFITCTEWNFSGREDYIVNVTDLK